VKKRQLIAIIDDDRPFRIALLELVRQLGFDARAFASADDFVAVDDQAFDCVVTDIQMPGMSGFDLVRMLKSRDQPIPVILITALAEPQLETKAASLGVVCCLRKPFLPHDLIECLEKALGH
jgi:FixJ family two-component response regulator